MMIKRSTTFTHGGNMNFEQKLSELIDEALLANVKLEDVQSALELHLHMIKDGDYDEK